MNRFMGFGIYIQADVCVFIETEPEIESSSSRPPGDILNQPLTRLLDASSQILGLVFSMTMFCQSVKVETFYA